MNQNPLALVKTLPPVIERYELKYVIPSSLIKPISDFVATWCTYDHHSLEYDDRFYPVNSLYFDTPGLRFLQQRMWGADERFNMRVRSYGDGTSGPRFAEIKLKNPRSVRKFRATLRDDEWPSFLTSHDAYLWRDGGGDPKENVSRMLFLRLATTYAIEPRIFTCYRRRAFVSHYDDYARVTMDVDMRYRPQDPTVATDPWSLSPDASCVHYDTETIYGDEAHYGANVVLELKATPGSFPVWMLELIRRFELKQVGFSKYMNSSLVEFSDHGHYMIDKRASSF